MGLFALSKREGADLYIDLGTANTLVVSRTRGLVVNEPSVVAYHELGSGQKSIIAVGGEAKNKIGRTPGQLVAGFPLREGVIADLDTTEAMLRYFMNKARGSMQFFKPRVVISLPYGVRDVEKKAVREAGRAAGAREVILIDEPMAAAIGTGLPIDRARGNMVIDIGGGTTEIAIISLYGIVHCESVRIGGHAFDQAIIDYIRKKYSLHVGNPSAEKVKIEIGSALPGDHETSAAIRGIDFVSGLPTEIKITADEIHHAINDRLIEIIEAVRHALENVPPDLIPDIIHNGVTLTGGGALIKHLDHRLKMELKIPVQVAEDPLLAIARGGGRAIKDPELLQRIAL